MRLTLAQRSNFLPPVAWGYSAWRAASLSLLSNEPFSLGREARLFLGHVRLHPGEHWLDIGTSTGFYADVLAGAGARITALDLSPAMLRAGARRHPDPRIAWVQGNAESLPARWQGQFDGVTVGATLNETYDSEQLLTEAARVLRPGGKLWLMYLRAIGGQLQQRLSRPAWGGLTFPAPAAVDAWLPECPLAAAAQFGAVRFELRLKDG